MHNIRLLIEYDGTAYAGWQRQIGVPSVQSAIETALHKITGEAAKDLHLTVAGRTDAGVHAVGQVANFKTHATFEPRRFATALNYWLAPDIRIHRADGVPFAFDARHWAQSKRYRYRIYIGPHPVAIGPKTAWHVRRVLSLPHMREAAAHLVGELDFESFRSIHCDARHAVRHMHGIAFQQYLRPPAGHFIDIVLHANAFCRHMCRIIVGSLVQVGAGRCPPQWIREVLTQRHRQAAGMTAPPWGLTLIDVEYSPKEAQTPP